MREKCATLWQFDDDVERRKSKKKRKFQQGFQTQQFFPKTENKQNKKKSIFFLPYLMLKATTVKRKEDLTERANERERERENREFMYLLVIGEDVDDYGWWYEERLCKKRKKKNCNRENVCERGKQS